MARFLNTRQRIWLSTANGLLRAFFSGNTHGCFFLMKFIYVGPFVFHVVTPCHDMKTFPHFWHFVRETHPSNQFHPGVNSLNPRECMRRWTRLLLVLIMACRLFGPNLPEPTLTCRQLNQWEQTLKQNVIIFIDDRHLKMSSTNSRPFYSHLNMLTGCFSERTTAKAATPVLMGRL